jgi:hypothetical protein
VSEWIGWVGRLRRTIYGRMEQLSFRAGAATVSGVLAVAVTAILLTLTQPGHHADPSREVRADAPISSSAAPPVVPFSLPVTHRATHKAAPFTEYEPASTKTPKAAPQASPSPDWPTPRPLPTIYPRRTNPPTITSPGGSGYPFPLPTGPGQPFSDPQAGPALPAH